MRRALLLRTTFAIGASAALAAPVTAQPPGAPSLAFPVACQPGRTCEIQHYVDRDPGPGVRDHRCGTMTYEGHNGVDIRLADSRRSVGASRCWLRPPGACGPYATANPTSR